MSALSKVSHERIARRIRILRTIKLFAPTAPAPPEHVTEEAAILPEVVDPEFAPLDDPIDGSEDVGIAVHSERAEEPGAPPDLEIAPGPAPDVDIEGLASVSPAPATPRAFVAHRASLAAEGCAYGILGVPGVLPTVRLMARAIRAIAGGGPAVSGERMPTSFPARPRMTVRRPGRRP